MQKLLLALTVVNLALLTFLLMRVPATAVPDPAGVLRGRALQITDDQGRVRASIVVHPADPAFPMPSGQGQRETVVLRLVDPNGRPSVRDRRLGKRRRPELRGRVRFSPCHIEGRRRGDVLEIDHQRTAGSS